MGFRSGLYGGRYLQMMENAGLAAYTQLRARLPLGGALLIVCSKGNNGRDGLVMARAAAQDGWRVAVLLAEGDPKAPDAMTNYKKALPLIFALQIRESAFVLLTMRFRSQRDTVNSQSRKGSYGSLHFFSTTHS